MNKKGQYIKMINIKHQIKQRSVWMLYICIFVLLKMNLRITSKWFSLLTYLQYYKFFPKSLSLHWDYVSFDYDGCYPCTFIFHFFSLFTSLNFSILPLKITKNVRRNENCRYSPFNTLSIIIYIFLEFQY